MGCLSSAARRGVWCEAAARSLASWSGWLRRPVASALIRTFIAGIFIAGIMPAQPSWSEPMHDDATGLTVAPPEGYSATWMAPLRGFLVRFSVRKPTDRDTGCEVAFEPLPENATLSQEELNHVADSQQWRDMSRAAMTVNYDVIETAPVVFGDIHGVVLVGDARPRPSFPARIQEVRTLAFLLETPKGRTTVACVGEKTDFEARRTEFEAVAHGVTPPR
jgi:hypothetical protein